MGAIVWASSFRRQGFGHGFSGVVVWALSFFLGAGLMGAEVLAPLLGRWLLDVACLGAIVWATSFLATRLLGSEFFF